MPILISKVLINPETKEKSTSSYHVFCLNRMVRDFLATRALLEGFGKVKFMEGENGFTAYLVKNEEEVVLIGEFRIFFTE